MIQTRRRRSPRKVARKALFERAYAGDIEALREIYHREHVTRMSGYNLKEMFGKERSEGCQV